MRITESRLRQIVREEIISEMPRVVLASSPIMYFRQYGSWWSVSPEQWPGLLDTGLSGRVVDLDRLATPLKKMPRDVKSYRDSDGSVNYNSSIPIYEPLDFGPDEWEWLDTHVKK